MADENKRGLEFSDQPEEDKVQESSPPETTWKRKSRRKPELDRSEIRITVGQLIAIKRRELKWSQEELAWQSGVSRTQIGRIERDEADPTVDTIEALESALGVELYERFMEQKRSRANAPDRPRKLRRSKSVLRQFAKDIKQKDISEKELQDLLKEALRSADDRSKKEKS
jgi:ribosome-binding protein aMBF1 (putative translation factor)